MAKKRKSRTVANIGIFVGAVCLLQLAFYFYFSGDNPESADSAISASIDKSMSGEDEGKRSLMRVHAAIQQFKLKNKRLPDALTELQPKFYSGSLTDPISKQPYEYTLNGTKYALRVVGQETKNPLNPASNPAAGGNVPDGLAAPAGPVKPGTIAAVLQAEEADQFYFNPAGLKDPFLSFDFAPRVQPKGSTPLEQYPLSQLTLTAVITGGETPIATVENPDGRGFTVKKGTRIGPNAGTVLEVLTDKIVVVETEIDFTGEQRTNRIEIKLRRNE